MRTLPWRERLQHTHTNHRLKLDLLFFAAGFAFDVYATRVGVDHVLMIVQQVCYLAVIGGILWIDFVREAQPEALRMSPRLEKLWDYRSLVFHFCLGTLMNLYSIFFLMSASLFSSVAFVALLFGAVILNELNAVRRQGLDVKVAFYALCMFCFWSLLIPVTLHHVSPVTFYLAFGATIGVLVFFGARLRRRIGLRAVVRRLLMPGLAASGLFLLLYQAGLIPPVPIAARTMGVYHRVDRVDGRFVLYHEPSRWRFWQTDDRQFMSEPGDTVNVFFAIYSPANFDDTVFVRWSLKDRATGWQDSDRIPIHITGGREGGFRGAATKQHYADGDWRVMIETRDGREIARLHFTVSSREPNPGRVFETTVY